MSEETENRTPDEIRQDIGLTREELGETVEALSAKTDVKGQARAKVDDIKDQVRERVDQARDKASDVTPGDAQDAGRATLSKARANPLPVTIAGAFTVGYLAGRRSSR